MTRRDPEVPADLFPLFVLLTDEGTLRVARSLDDLSWHERIDLDEAPTWGWTTRGDRYLVGWSDEHDCIALEKAGTDEVQLFLNLLNWHRYWLETKRREPGYMAGLDDLALIDEPALHLRVWSDR